MTSKLLHVAPAVAGTSSASPAAAALGHARGHAAIASFHAALGEALEAGSGARAAPVATSAQSGLAGVAGALPFIGTVAPELKGWLGGANAATGSGGAGSALQVGAAEGDDAEAPAGDHAGRRRAPLAHAGAAAQPGIALMAGAAEQGAIAAAGQQGASAAQQVHAAHEGQAGRAVLGTHQAHPAEAVTAGARTPAGGADPAAAGPKAIPASNAAGAHLAPVATNAAAGTRHAARPARPGVADQASGAAPQAVVATALSGREQAAQAAPRTTARAGAEKLVTRLSDVSGEGAAASHRPGKAEKAGRAAGPQQAREPARSDDPGAAPSGAAAGRDLTAPPPPTVAAGTGPRALRADPTEAASASAAAILPPAPGGQDVQGAILTSAAHLRVDAGDLGSLELHLRMRGGAVHLRVDGDAARIVEARASELSRSLAGEGLRLAPLEPPAQQGQELRGGADGGRQGQERQGAWEEAADARQRPPPPPAPARSAGPATSTTTAAGGIHVKA